MADAPVHEFEKVRFFSDHVETNGAEFEYSRVRSLDFARLTQTASGQPHHQTILAITLADGSKPVDLSTVPIQKIFGQDNYNPRADALEAICRFPRSFVIHRHSLSPVSAPASSPRPVVERGDRAGRKLPPRLTSGDPAGARRAWGPARE